MLELSGVFSKVVRKADYITGFSSAKLRSELPGFLCDIDKMFKQGLVNQRSRAVSTLTMRNKTMSFCKLLVRAFLTHKLTPLFCVAAELA
jgi:hypothetical protein